MKLTITRVGRHKLLKDGVEVSQHVDLKEAYERASGLPVGIYTLVTADERIVVTAPAVVPPPPPPPPPVEEPPPPPPPIEDPPPPPTGDTFGPSVIDAQLRVWTLGPEGLWGNAGNFLALVDGQPVPSPAGAGFGNAYVKAFLFFGGRVFGVTAADQWSVLDPSGSSTLMGDPRVIVVPVPLPPGGPVTPPPPLPAPSPLASPHGTVVEGAGASVTDYYGKVWALRDHDTPDDYKGSGGEQGGAMFVGYAVSEDGVYDPDPPHAIKLAVFHTPAPTIWMGDGIGFWYRGALTYGNPDPDWTFAEDPFVPPVPRPTPTVGDRSLLGGWRFPPAHGNLAIDFATMRAWLSAKFENPGDVLEFQLPPMGTGDDPNQWPLVTPTRSIPAWWGNGSNKDYANGLYYGDLTGSGEKLWVAPFVNYDMAPSPVTILYAADGETKTINLPRQMFAGFVKRGPGLRPYLGAGGYASGQGTSAGPTLATLDGQRLIAYDGQSLSSPGADLKDWNTRAPRDPNYTPVWNVDQWVAWNPRTVNGVLEGRWASDRIWAGGLELPEGISYWPRMATGVVYYRLQNLTFGAPAADRTYRYLYNATTYQLDRYELTGIGEVRGQELGPDGRVYLATQTFFSGEPVIVTAFK